MFEELSDPIVNKFIDTTGSQNLRLNYKKNTCGLFKFEPYQDALIGEFYCGGAKTYSLKLQGDHKNPYKSATKGFRMDDSAETHEAFKNMALDGSHEFHQQQLKSGRITAQKHKIRTVITPLKDLTRTLNGKRYAYFDKDGLVTTLPYGLSPDRYKDLRQWDGAEPQRIPVD